MSAAAPSTTSFVVVANRLPIKRVGTGWQTSPGGLVSALAPVLRERRGAWVGWTGVVDGESAPEDHDGMHLSSVPLSASDVADYYEGFSNSTVWPLYHDNVRPPRYHRHWWRCYRAVNERFADAAAAVAAPEAVVWIHDYQLQLVPALVRDRRPDVRIGFFLHIPFPPEQLFERLPWRADLLQGLLGADLVGFQTAADSRNFAGICRRILGLAGQDGEVEVDGRTVRARTFPISIDTPKVVAAATEAGTVERAAALRRDLGDPDIVILGVDRLDYTKGIDLRLRAFGELLEEGELEAPGAAFVQVAVPSREVVAEYGAERDRIERRVGELNGRFGRLGSPVVHYARRGLPFDELVALYRAADVMVVTPWRDGMNLVAKEYVAARVDDTGALVLSEFAGAAQEFESAFIVNPHDLEGVKNAILDAIRDDPVSLRWRMRRLREAVLGHTVQDWAVKFLSSLEGGDGR